MSESHEVPSGFNLAPEVPHSFQTTSRASGLSRSNSGGEEKTHSEIHSSLDTIHLRSRPVSLVDEGRLFLTYGKKNAFKNECKDYESYSSRHYSHLDEHAWRYKHQIPSEHYQPRDYGECDEFRTRHQFRELETNRLDYLSLSLSPPTRQKESFYAHESSSL